MIAALVLFLQQHGPDEHYAGGATSKIAGTTALAGKFFRFLMTTVPQWIQIGGILMTALVGGGSGLYGYNYMMHDNDFCQLCHIMDTAWNRFQVSAHECHMREGTDSARTLVTLTAAHALHLKSDSSALMKARLAPHKGNCSTCHDPHKQKEPAEAYKTCATAQCHASADTRTASSRRRSARRRAPAAVRFASFARVARPTLLVQQAAVARQTMDTTFRHSYHKSLACLECHGTTETHGGLKIAAPAGCLGCHHSAQQKVPCATCHKTESLPAYSVPVTFAITARPNAVTRPLSFTHTRHADVTCTRCHSSDAKRTVTPAACTTCHSEHHVATANCANCHPSARTGHDRGVHSGCAGCHTDTRLASLPAGRPLCLVCHQEQRNHYPARDCATCHALDPNVMLHAGRSGGGGGHNR